jgi:hypothetical protein
MSDKKPTLRDFLEAAGRQDFEKAQTLFNSLTDEAEKAGDKDAVQMRLVVYASLAGGVMGSLASWAGKEPVPREELGWAIKAAKHSIEHLELVHDAMSEEIKETAH